MKSALLKYKIGLLVLVVFTVGLVGFVVMQASKAKADLKTKETATKIAEKLNDYVYQGGIPSSLSKAGIRDVPATIRYTKLSDTEYRFCVTYQAASSGFNPDTAVQEAVTGYYMSQLGGSTDDLPGYLAIKSAHKKGENCQEVKIQSSLGDSFFNFDTPSSDDTPSFDSNSLDQYYLSPDQSLDTTTPYQYPVQ